MVKLTDINAFPLERNAGISSNLISVKPIAPGHVAILKQAFENRASSQNWCGYAIIDHIPESLYMSAVSCESERQVAVVLFLNSLDQALFLFGDEDDNFYLLNEHGQTIYVEENLGALLDRFQRNHSH